MRFEDSERGGGHVFILGPARSGTSLLFKALCLHPQAAWISNWMIRAPGLPQLAVLNRISRRLPDQCRRCWFDDRGNAYVYGTRRPLRRRLLPMPAEGEPVFRHCGMSGSDEAEPDLDRLRRTIAAIRHAAGGQVFVNKRIANNRRVPLLAAALPDAKFVFLCRDGRAVAYSLAQVDWWPDDVVWWYGGTPRQWAAEGGDPWEICARNWVEELRAAERGLAAVPDTQRLDLRYEDLIRDPVRTLEKIAEFAGLAATGTWLEDLTRLRYPDRNERWRSALPPHTIARISGIQHAELVRHGYLEES
ncbi:MAG: hypothetical protein GEV03_25325 [Streptosporangiales bacterium]|nr:hypothetical protein [Streptosporangiales bacterium]